MNDKGYQRIVGLRDFWEIFRARVGWLLIAFLLVAAGLKLGSATLVEKKYESTATLYILRRENEALHRECDRMRENIAMLEEERRQLHEEIRRLRQDAAGE